MDTEIKFAKMKKVLKMDGGEGCTTTFFFYCFNNFKLIKSLFITKFTDSIHLFNSWDSKC